jgi:hypothetical protein
MNGEFNLDEYYDLAKLLDAEIAGNETRIQCLNRIIRGLKAYEDAAQNSGA